MTEANEHSEFEVWLKSSDADLLSYKLIPVLESANS